MNPAFTTSLHFIHLIEFRKTSLSFGVFGHLSYDVHVLAYFSSILMTAESDALYETHFDVVYLRVELRKREVLRLSCNTLRSQKFRVASCPLLRLG